MSSIVQRLRLASLCLLLVLQSSEALAEDAINLDLSATDRSLPADRLLQSSATHSDSVAINQNGSSVTIASDSLLTPAQFLAVAQVLAGGQQIQLGAAGNAIGGNVSLAGVSQPLSGLVVPGGVTFVHDFAVSNINVSGNLVNSGSIFATASNATTIATIAATNIVNQPGGLISSTLAGAPLSLNLIAAQNFFNAGSIISSGSLSVSAGGSITNALPAGVTGVQPIMQALNSMNLFSASGLINNAGLLQSQNANINLSTAAAANLALNNIGGILSAVNGSVNLRAADFMQKQDTAIFGGNINTSALNIFSGDGHVNVAVQELLGTVNINAGEAHVTAATSQLNLGAINLTGDPTFYNQSGDIVISSNLNFGGAPLALVASGNIRTVSGAGVISTASASGSGGELTLIAGANFTVSGGSCCVKPPGVGDATAILSILGASATGGSIDLSTGAQITTLSTQSTAANGSGGKLTMVAFANADPQSGRIVLPASLTVSTGGKGTGSNGGVNIIAGANSGGAVAMGAISATGGAGAGNISVAVANPVLSGGGGCAPCLTIQNGQITGGSIAGSATTNNGSVALGDLIGGAASILAGGAVSVGAVITDGTPGSDGGAITVATNGVLTLNGATISANAGAGGYSGGKISLSADTVSMPGHMAVTANASGNGNGGAFTLNAKNAASATIGAGAGEFSVSATGGSAGSSAGKGGTLEVTLSGSLTIDVLSLSLGPLGNNGDGGTVKLNANKLMVNGSLIADGVGVGNGGLVSIETGSGLSVFAPPSPSYVSAVSVRGGAISGNAGAIFLETRSGDITIGDGSALGLTGINGDGGNLYLNTAFFSGGKINAQGTISVDAGGNGTGGNIYVQTDRFNVTSGNLLISANGAGNGNGGYYTCTGTTQIFPLIIGLGVGEISFSLTGGAPGSASGNGGSININHPLDIVADPLAINVRPLGNNGNGGSVFFWGGFFNTNFGASVGVRITGPMQLDGVGIGDGGGLGIIHKNTSPFVFGDSSVNGIGGTFSARAGAISGKGGRASVQGNNFSGGGVVVNNWSDIDVSTTNGGGGSLTLLGTFGPASIPGGVIDMSAVGLGTGDGGFIYIQGSTVNLSGLSFLDLRADAAGSGNGGGVYYQSSGNINIGPGSVTMSARGGSPGSAAGDGGTVSVAGTLSDVFVNPAFFQSGPRGLNGKGGSFNMYGTNIHVAGSLNADGVGVGDGGYIRFASQTVAALNIGVPSGNGIDGSATARAGAGGGSGGTLQISNNTGFGGGGNVVVNSAANLSVQATNGNGGTIDLTTYSSSTATVLLPRGETFSVDAAGGGNFKGGSFNIAANYLGTFGAAAAPVTITANGIGSGNGGTIGVATQMNDADFSIGPGAGQLALIANSGGAGGNAGSVTLTAGRDLSVNTAGVTAKALGVNGNGAVFNWRSGLSSPTGGALRVTGAIDAIGAGTGDGGKISLNINDASNPFRVGAVGANSFVSGSITATTSNGTPGTVTIQNAAAAPLNVDLVGTITANSLSGSRGAVTLSQPGQSVSVTGSGAINGNVVTTGSIINYNLSAGGALYLTSATATAGGLSLTVGGPGASINILPGGIASATGGNVAVDASLVQSSGRISASGGNVNVTTDVLTVNGIIDANNNNGQISISSAGTLTLNGAAVLRVTGGGTPSISLTAGAGNDINLNGSYAFDPGANGAVTFFANSVLIANCAVETIFSGLGFVFNTPLLTLPDNGVIQAMAPGSSITIQSVAAPLRIVVPQNSSSSIVTNGGAITIMAAAGQTLDIDSSGPGSSTLNFLTGGAQPVTISASANTAVAAGVSLVTDSDTTITVDGGNTLNLSGSVSSTKSAGSITIQSTSGDLSMSGTGSVAFTSAASNVITLSVPAANALNLLSSRSFSPEAASGNNAQLIVSAGTLNLDAGVTITNTVAVGGMFQINADVVGVAGGGAAAVQGMSLVLSPRSGAGIAFGVNGLGNAALNFNNPVTIQGTSVTILPSMTLSSTGTITLSPSVLLDVQGAVSASLVDVVSLGNLMVSGVGTLSGTGANGSIRLRAPAGTLNIVQSLTFSPSGAGFLTLDAITIDLANGVSVQNALVNSQILLPFSGCCGAADLRVATGGAATIGTAGGAVVVNTSRPVNISPSAGGNATLNITGGNFNVTGSGSLAIQNGVSLIAANDVNLTPSANSVTISDNVTLTAAGNVVVSAPGGISIGTVGGAPVAVNAGTLAGGLPALSTNFADFDMSGVTRSGGIALTSGAAPLALNDNVTMIAAGGNVALQGAQAISIGSGSALFAQGGNVWLDAGTKVDVAAGSTIAAIGRGLSGPDIVVSGGTVANFQGGGLAVYAGVPGLNYNTLLHNMVLSRTVADQNMISAFADTTGAGINMSNGSVIEMIATGAGEVMVPGATFNLNGGVLSIDPPGFPIDMTGATFFAVGPAVVPLVPPVPVAVLPGAAGPVMPVVVAGKALPPVVVTVNPPVRQQVPLDTINIGVDIPAIKSEEEVQKVGGAQKLDAGNFIVANSCQVFSFGNDDQALLIGQAGTEFSEQGTEGGAAQVSLKSGKLLVATGKRPVGIATARGSIQIPSGAAVVVEQPDARGVRVACLSGQNTVIEISGERITLARGEELIVADSAVADEDLIPTDGVDRSEILTGTIIATSRVSRRRFDESKMAEVEVAVQVRCSSNRAVRTRMQKLHQSMAGTVPKHISTGAPLPGSQGASILHPVAHIQTAPGIVHPLASVSSTRAIRQLSGGKVTAVSPGVFSYHSGELLVSSRTPTRLMLPDGHVDIRAGAIVLVDSTDGVVSVRNLWEPSRDSVSYRNNGDSVKLYSGEELLVSKVSDKLSPLKSDSVGRRRSQRLLGKTSLITSEFSHLSLLQKSPLLRAVRKSDREVAGRIEKMSVILSIVTASHGAYSPHIP